MCNTKTTWLLVPLIFMAGCNPATEPDPNGQQDTHTERFDDARIQDPQADEWLSYGRDYSEQRFVSSDQINKANIADLGLAYSVDLGTKLGNIATPLVVNGLLIFPTNWNVVYAIDARTGEQRWRFDPQVPRRYTRVMGAAASRGVAVYGDSVFIATMDGRLIAVDVETGEQRWETNTFDGGNCNLPDALPACFISGAPRAARGKVFIGFGGADLNARGYVSAYDAETGELAWRFFTVPNDPSKPEHPEMKLASDTWSEGWWKRGIGGGGTVWDSIVYDQAFDQVIIGTGNAGGVYPRAIRSPGGGDNLFLASIIALDVETGSMNWYYQAIPGEQWDYTAAQPLILADLEFDNEPRKVVMQAPKNGFFYVLDREDGTLLGAEKFAEVTWAESIDEATGRPIETPQSDYSEEPKWIYPATLGAGNWQPPAYNPETNLVYIPSREAGFLFGMSKDIGPDKPFEVKHGMIHSGLELKKFEVLVAEAGPPPIAPQGLLKAYDPVAGEVVWRTPMEHIWNGGALTTAGDLVFTGDAMGKFRAYDALTGEELWSFDTYTSIASSPISYELDGTQYVALLTGSGMLMNQLGFSGPTAIYRYGNGGELLVFKLDGKARLEQPEIVDRSLPEPPERIGTAADVADGSDLYHTYCFSCHGGAVRSSAIMPDLRKMTLERHEIFDQIVLEGVLEPLGMARFDDVLTPAQTKQIHAYIIDRAQQDYALGAGDEYEYRGGM
ncbi:MAG: PQQ-dependent dehydrogenase, methanol/ethanol family [Gammaproteobacteria bacterium]|nr:PQQ-dependent dehydrogenase, methanol/ethanol family [Gammaproteobacteria bacterium]